MAILLPTAGLDVSRVAQGKLCLPLLLLRARPLQQLLLVPMVGTPELRFCRKSNSIAGRCGVDFGGATCDPAGPYGGCCSSYGFASHSVLCFILYLPSESDIP